MKNNEISNRKHDVPDILMMNKERNRGRSMALNITNALGEHIPIRGWGRKGSGLCDRLAL